MTCTKHITHGSYIIADFRLIIHYFMWVLQKYGFAYYWIQTAKMGLGYFIPPGAGWLGLLFEWVRTLSHIFRKPLLIPGR